MMLAVSAGSSSVSLDASVPYVDDPVRPVLVDVPDRERDRTLDGESAGQRWERLQETPEEVGELTERQRALRLFVA